MKNKSEIINELINLFDRINIQTPSNFDDISEYIFNNINDDYSQDDIAFCFKLWIESKS